MASGDARRAAAINAVLSVLAPCVFGYDDGIHVEFDKLLVKMFARAPEQHVKDDIRDALQHVQQVITATIVNHAAYYSKNQRKAYQNC